MPNKTYTNVYVSNKSANSYFFELWKYRELFYFFLWRDFIVRYKQTILGITWSVIRPLVVMLIFTVVFSFIAKLPSKDIPYPLLVLSALIPWQFFSNSLSEAGNSVINNSNLVSKIYFPRLILPLSTISVCLVDFIIAFLILLFFMAWYGVTPDWRIVFLPFIIILTLLLSIGVGVWMAALSAKYKDFQYVIPFIIQISLYASPVGYSIEIIPENLRFVFSLNPLVGIIDGYRWVLLGSNYEFYATGFLISVVISFAIFLYGIFYFRRVENKIVDIV